MTWHADPAALRAYAQGTAPDTVAWSVETHVTDCGPCRAALSQHLSPADGELLTSVRSTLVLPEQPHTNRIGMRAWPVVSSRRPWPAIRSGVLGPWWAWAGFAIVGTALLAAASLIPVAATGAQLSGLVLLSPVLPVALVALVYAVADRDGTTDTTPRGGLELALLRTAIILAMTIPLVTAVRWMHGTPTAAWLLPGLGLCLASLATGTWIGVQRTATVVTSTWIALSVIVMVRRSLPGSLEIVMATNAAQPLWWILLAASMAVLLWRMGRVDTPPRLHRRTFS